MPHLKHVGGFGLTLRQRQAVAAGYDGAVFADRHGQVSEATIWNVGFFDGDGVVWPNTPALRGISQILIDEGLARLGVAVRYQSVPVERLGAFRAAFLSNSNTYGRPLSAIGAQSFAVDPEVTSLIRRAYELTPFAPIGA
jgi:branched-subunit amino acid aminotransferase/4-amino-4-deoxychorismate lyase